MQRGQGSDARGIDTDYDRIGLLDCLRGLALFGVLFVNMAWFAAGGRADAPAPTSDLAMAAVDRWVGGFMQVFVYAKANTLFTLLFGIGFAIQMQRLEARTAEAAKVYLRRLVFLLAIGCAHLFGLWQGEILHVYAIAGFILLTMRRWSSVALLTGACVLILALHPLLTHWSELVPALGLSPDALANSISPAQTDARRFDAFVGGGYFDVVAAQWQSLAASGYFKTGLATWVAYALGRFMIGVCLARTSALTDPGRHARIHWAVALLALPLGVVCTLLRWPLQRLHIDAAEWRILIDTAQLIGTLLMTASYVSWVAIGWSTPRIRKVLEVFMPVGRMALTNYLSQTLFNMAVFFGFGLGLVGRFGITHCLVLSLCFYALQMLASWAWLRGHRFGPAEWLWRWWTYRQRPSWRLPHRRPL